MGYKENKRLVTSLFHPVEILDNGLALLDSVFDRLRRPSIQDSAPALFLLAPTIVILGIFGIAPLGYAVYMSLFDLKGGVGPFVGLSNYARALTNESFWNSFLNTVYYVVGTVPITMLISFFAANALFRIKRFRSIFRTVYFLPYITSTVAAAMVWRYFFKPDIGLVNMALIRIGLPTQTWLLEPRGVLHILTQGHIPETVGPSLALCCVIAFEIWHACGFMTVVFLAGLSAVPRELEDAAKIDGAGPVRLIRHIIVPLLSPTIFFLAIISVIKSFQAFNSFYAMTGTGRGPLDTTQNMTVYIYSNFYEYGRWGYGAAAATCLCIAIMALTLLQWRLVGHKVHYE